MVGPELFMWIYLLLPVAVISFLYSRRPKVTPRYSMLVSPAFVALAAVSVSRLGRWSRQRVDRGKVGWASLIAGSVGALALATASFADYNLYFDPSLRKPDFRGAVRYVCQNRAWDEAIVLVSGHMFPIFDYYCPESDRYLIPDDPVLRLDNQVRLDVVDHLQQVVEGKSAVWLLLWQDDVIDPQDIVAGLLLSQGRELPVPALFHDVRIRHIELSTDAHFAWESWLSFPVGAHWEGGIELLDARINKKWFRRGDPIQLTLYWRTDRRVERSYTVFVHVERDGERTQHDGWPANGARPTISWRPGEIIEDRHLIEIPYWLPAGVYPVSVGLYDHGATGAPRLPVIDADSVAMADHIVLGSIRLLPGVP